MAASSRRGRPAGGASSQPKTLADYPFYIRESLAYQEAFRKLEFAPEEIFFGTVPCPSGGLDVGIAVISQGKKFGCTAESGVSVPDDQIRAEWTDATKVWNRSSDEELDRVWLSSFVCRNAVQLIWALMNKGFRLPPNPHLPSSLAA